MWSLTTAEVNAETCVFCKINHGERRCVLRKIIVFFPVQWNIYDKLNKSYGFTMIVKKQLQSFFNRLQSPYDHKALWFLQNTSS